MTVPIIFANQIGPIPLAYLDQNFAALTAPAGASQIGYNQGGTGAGDTTVQAVLRNRVNVTDFCANGTSGVIVDKTGSVDSTLGIQAAITAVGVGGGEVYFPAGTYKVTSTLTVSTAHTWLVGAGPNASQILFLPTAADTCLLFSAGGSILYRCGVDSLSLYSTDSTYAKIGVNTRDCSEFKMRHFVIAGSISHSSSSMWSSGAGTSTGLQTNGRDNTTFENVTIVADKPLVISYNPNSAISLDNTVFRDLYLIAYANPKIEVYNDGVHPVNLTQIKFEGRQAWNGGTHGFMWTDTTSIAVSNGVSFYGVRDEQGTDPTAYLFYIDKKSTGRLQNLSIENCYGGDDGGGAVRNGLYLRNCDDVFLRDFYYTATTGGVALDMNSTVRGLVGLSCFWQDNATAAVIAGQRLVYAAPYKMGVAPLPSNFVYDQDQTYLMESVSDVSIGGSIITLLTNGTDVSLGATANGTVMISSDSGVCAQFLVAGGVVVLDSQVGTDFSITKDNALKINLYFDAGNYTIQNKTAATIKVRYILAGSYATF